MIQINEEMDKDEKFGSIKLFTGFLQMVGYDPSVFVATSAANTGIDNCQLQLINRFGFPHYLTTLFQERGHNAQGPWMTGMYVIFTNWIMFLKLALTMFLPSTQQTNEPSKYEGMNTVIPSLSQERRITPVSSALTVSFI